MSAPAEWVPVTEDPETKRLKVEGGWLYRVHGQKTTTLAFVPELGNRYGSYLEQIVEALDKIEAHTPGADSS